MPGGDGTGPMGTGPMTGRAAGYCAGYAMPGHMNPMGQGRGFWGRRRGWGRGFGFGVGRFRWAPMGTGYPAYGPVAPPPEQELETLRQQASYFQSALADIQKRIDELAAQTK